MINKNRKAYGRGHIFVIPLVFCREVHFSPIRTLCCLFERYNRIKKNDFGQNGRLRALSIVGRTTYSRTTCYANQKSYNFIFGWKVFVPVL